LGGAVVLGKGRAVVETGSADDRAGVSDPEPVQLPKSIRTTAKAMANAPRRMCTIIAVSYVVR